jgi:hypothetical protein
MSRRRERQTSKAPPKRSYLVFVEGERTEEIYLTHWARRLRDRVAVSVDPFRGVPLSLVERAVEKKERSDREERRGRGAAWDEVWCLFDRDEHPNFERALDLATRKGISVAMSNPCIELWFILHHRDHAAYVERDRIQSACRRDLGFDKSPSASDLDALDPRYPDALARAIALDQKHHGDGSPPGSNPSTSVWRLVESLRGEGAGTGWAKEGRPAASVSPGR